jgi:hypothetical protein
MRIIGRRSAHHQKLPLDYRQPVRMSRLPDVPVPCSGAPGRLILQRVSPSTLTGRGAFRVQARAIRQSTIADWRWITVVTAFTTPTIASMFAAAFAGGATANVSDDVMPAAAAR